MNSFHPSPQDPDYAAYAVLFNDLSRSVSMVGPAGHVLLLSEREYLAELMWAEGYRPTPERIAEATGEARRQQGPEESTVDRR